MRLTVTAAAALTATAILAGCADNDAAVIEPAGPVGSQDRQVVTVHRDVPFDRRCNRRRSHRQADIRRLAGRQHEVLTGLSVRTVAHGVLAAA
jgi:hypothetical protein